MERDLHPRPVAIPDGKARLIDEPRLQGAIRIDPNHLTPHMFQRRQLVRTGHDRAAEYREGTLHIAPDEALRIHRRIARVGLGGTLGTDILQVPLRVVVMRAEMMLDRPRP